MNRYVIAEQQRLEADLADLESRLARSKKGPGLRTRSVRSFLSALRRHKREMLRDLDLRLDAQRVTVN